MIQEIKVLCQLYFREEVNNKNGLYAIILYVVSSIFTVYLAVEHLDEASIWIGLFWVIQTFTCLNAATKSFQYSKGRDYYYYQLAGPRSFILSKIIYNAVLMSAVFLISLATFSSMLGFPLPSLKAFLLVGIIGTTALSGLLTMMSAITFHANNNYTLMAILSLPIMIPLLVVLIQTSEFILTGVPITDYLSQIFILIALNVITITLSFVLFPYLCKD